MWVYELVLCWVTAKWYEISYAWKTASLKSYTCFFSCICDLEPYSIRVVIIDQSQSSRSIKCAQLHKWAIHSSLSNSNTQIQRVWKSLDFCLFVFVFKKWQIQNYLKYFLRKSVNCSWNFTATPIRNWHLMKLRIYIMWKIWHEPKSIANILKK